jgi:hypothetical protein
VSKQADRERIYFARRDAIRNTLTGQGTPEELAELWVSAWEVEAEDRGLDRHARSFWDDAIDWILDHRPARRVADMEEADHTR